MESENLTSSSSPSSTSPTSHHSPTTSAAAPAAKSLSDLSYTTTGASPSLSSSRNTSPHSITITHSSSPSQQSALVDITSTVDLHSNPNLSSVPKQDFKMDRNPFQSINERRNKLSADHTNANGGTQQQQPSPSQAHFPSQALRPNMQQLVTPSRGLASSNWRSQGTGAAADEQSYGTTSSRGSSGEYSASFEAAIANNMAAPLPHPSSILRQVSQPQASPTYVSPRADHYPPSQLDFLSGIATTPTHNNNNNNGINANAASALGGMNAAGEGSPSGLHFPNMGMDGIYAYCFDRGNGQYTRLVPVDMLPALKDIPALQQGCAGMMVLPLPRGVPQGGRSSNTELIALKSPPNTPNTSKDTIQSRIDTIVASTPPTPPHHQHTLSGGLGGVSTALVTTSGGAGGSGTHGTSYTVSHPFDSNNNNGHHNNNNSNNGGHGRNGPGGQGAHSGHGAGGQQPQRRPKVYCDKWVHEGVCAFTQQGCKYKHEMPFDKVTQHALGLFHGFPAWWKKHQADLSRQREGPAVVPSMGAIGPGGTGLGITGGMNGSGDGGAQDLGALGSGRYMGRGGAPGAGSGAVMGFIEGKGDGAGMSSSPTTPGLPSWRRGGEQHSAEQKTLGTGRGMARGATSGMRNPMVSYGSPFGPIAPPARTFGTGPSANANPYSSLESLEETKVAANSGEEEPAAETSRSSGARLN
ncbi:hypothetical protein F5B19DRAFT_492935 [Rostrohypoxylon terebratum]|nr:hypothetical protein F5B19DRAFT_492935 [Rostrohypoxylon terebratum]